MRHIPCSGGCGKSIKTDAPSFPWIIDTFTCGDCLVNDFNQAIENFKSFFDGFRKRPSLIKALYQYRQGIAIEDMEA